MGEIVQEYLDYKLSQRCAMTTVENYKRLLSYFITSLNIKGKYDITEISEQVWKASCSIIIESNYAAAFFAYMQSKGAYTLTDVI